MILKNNTVTFDGEKGPVEIKRNDRGIPVITAASDRDAFFALGWVHANDRQLQMALSRIFLQGRTAEKISASEESIESDKYIRSLNLYPDMAQQKKFLDREAGEAIWSYSAGVNCYLENGGTVPELKLIKCIPEPWETEDTMLLCKALAYFGVAALQGDMKKIIVRMARNNIDEKRIKELFPCLTEEINVELLKKINLSRESCFVSAKHSPMFPGFDGGSVWAVSGRLTDNGMPILAGSINAHVNRMPTVWHEVIIRLPEDDIIGFTIPGIPFVLSGRNRNLSFSPVNSNMDMIDFRIEECRGGKYRRGNMWHLFDVRREVIKTKKGEEIKIDFHENELGVLEGDPSEDGFYLIRSWSGGKDCGAADVNGLYNLMRARTVREAMKHCRDLDAISFNVVMADTGGNIGCQMSGRLNNRPSGGSGLLPLPAWDRNCANRGYVSKNRLPSIYNPLDGIIVIAGQDISHRGNSLPVNLPGADYIARRIEQLIRQRKNLTVEYMKEIQYDLYSIHAEILLKMLSPLITDTKKGKALKDWDMEYKAGSHGAAIFENIYSSIIESVFGDFVSGDDTHGTGFNEWPLPDYYYGNLDNIILNKKSAWFKYGSRDDIMRPAISGGLRKKSGNPGKTQKIYFKHILFGNRLPSFFRLDYGPVKLSGGRATVSGVQEIKSSARRAVSAPSCRIIASMSDGSLSTNTVGGSYDRPFSEFYNSNTKDWIYGIYKKLS